MNMCNAVATATAWRIPTGTAKPVVRCASSAAGTGCGATALSCQTPQDQCAATNDCAASEDCTAERLRTDVYGAPIASAPGAQADEIVHAQDCFALARRHGAGDIGPGPLPLAGALVETELREMVLGTIAEGCIGETVAALEAAEACAHCADPVARAVLERIAEDETRHAQLAWRFVSWALETGPGSLRGQVRAAFAREVETALPAASLSSELDRRLLEHGLMTDALRVALRARVLREVIAPCADALLASAGSSACAAERAAQASAALL
jgi:hypothetical protein